jgi:hypothetical protein
MLETSFNASKIGLASYVRISGCRFVFSALFIAQKLPNSDESTRARLTLYHPSLPSRGLMASSDDPSCLSQKVINKINPVPLDSQAR